MKQVQFSIVKAVEEHPTVVFAHSPSADVELMSAVSRVNPVQIAVEIGTNQVHIRATIIHPWAATLSGETAAMYFS